MNTGGQSPGPPPPPHIPVRPIWLCRACAADWPCLTARTLLPLDYYADPLSLFVYLGAALQAATEDLYRLNPDPGPDPRLLHARFLAWVNPRLLITRARLGADLGGNRRRPRGGYPRSDPIGTTSTPHASTRHDNPT